MRLTSIVTSLLCALLPVACSDSTIGEDEGTGGSASPGSQSGDGDDDGDGDGSGGRDASGGAEGEGSKRESSTGGAPPNSPKEPEGFQPWGICAAPVEPGEAITDMKTRGSGACEGETLESVLEATFDAFADLADISELPDEDGADGSFVYPFLKDDGRFSLAFKRGSGDCPSGCTSNEWTYIETNDECIPTKRGSYSRLHQEGCYQVEGAPLWGLPPPGPPIGNCDGDDSPFDLEGRYTVPFTGKRTACTDKKSSEPASEVSGELTLTIIVDDEDPTTGIVKIQSDDFDYPWLEAQELPATFLRGRVDAYLQSDSSDACFESNDASLNLDFEGCSESQLNLEEARSLACDDDYCKGQLQLKLDLKGLWETP